MSAVPEVPTVVLIHGACVDVPTRVFFPKRGGDPRSPAHDASVARLVCSVCPVRKSCLTWAVGPGNSQLSGIWGGTNEIERRALRRQIAAGRPLGQVVAEAPCPSSARHPSLLSERAS